MLKRMGLYKGVNLGGWLSQCDYTHHRLDTFITEADFAAIAAWGLDHVRLPVDFNVLENAWDDFTGPGFEKIDFAIAMCSKYGLKLVLDLHKTRGFYYDVPTSTMHEEFFSQARYQEHFCDLWEVLARRYGRLADRVIFELLNEVVSPDHADIWNAVSSRAIARIRLHAPDTFILVGGASWNHASAVPALLPPADDRIIYNFHCYDPQPYTHQGAYWVDALDKSVRIAYADSGMDVAAFEALFAPAIKAAEERGTTLYCGEYGVIDVVPPADAILWCQAIARVFRKHGIPHAMWNYKQLDFGLTDARWDALRQQLIDTM